MPNLIENPSQELAAENEVKLRPAPKPSKLPREAVGWRIVRLAIALPLVVISLLALFPFSVLPVSSQAVVNARLSRVRAPIEGELGTVKLETGDVVTAGEVLTTMTAPRTLMRTEEVGDLRTLADLQQESSRVGALLTAGLMEKARYDQMYNQYLAHVASDAQSQITEAQLEAVESQKRAQAAAQEVQRDQQAMADHLIPRSMLDQAQQKADAAQQTLADKQAQLRRLQKQLSDAKSGYVFDTASPPAFLAARDQAATDVERLQAQKSALDQRIIRGGGGPTASPMAAFGSSGSNTVVSPVSGTIWSRSIATGQAVEEGDDMFRIADANSIHVEVWLDRRYGPQLSIGDIALVYMSGMGTELQGRVISFEGTSRRMNDEEINAIDLQAVHPDQYHVTIELQPQDRKAAYIGQAAKVLFPGSKHPFRSRMYFLLTRL